MNDNYKDRQADADSAQVDRRIGRLVASLAATDAAASVFKLASACLSDLIVLQRVDSVAVIDEGRQVRFRAGWTDGSIALDEQVVFGSDQLTIRDLVDAGDVVRTHVSEATSGDATTRMVQAGVSELMLVPMTAGEVVMGALCLASRQLFTQRDEVVAARVAHLTAGVLMGHDLAAQRRRRIEAERSYAVKLELLNTSSHQFAAVKTEPAVFAIAADVIPKMVNCDRIAYATRRDVDDSISIHLLQADGTTTPAGEIPIEDSALGDVLQSGEVRSTPDIRGCKYADTQVLSTQGFRSSMAVPVVIDDGINAVLAVSSTAFASFQEDERQLLKMFARMMGSTLDRINLIDKLEHLARHDGLTTLTNRREFDRVFSEAVEEINRTGEAATVCYLDLDRFKEVNDTHGHAAGDAMLVTMSAQFRNQTAVDDIVARVGGDEFVILLRNCPVPRALDVAERLRTWAGSHPVPWQDQMLPISLSIGLAEVGTGADAAAVLQAADAACYAAKRRGRNQIAVADQPQ